MIAPTPSPLPTATPPPKAKPKAKKSFLNGDYLEALNSMKQAKEKHTVKKKKGEKKKKEKKVPTNKDTRRASCPAQPPKTVPHGVFHRPVSILNLTSKLCMRRASVPSDSLSSLSKMSSAVRRGSKRLVQTVIEKHKKVVPSMVGALFESLQGTNMIESTGSCDGRRPTPFQHLATSESGSKFPNIPLYVLSENASLEITDSWKWKIEVRDRRHRLPFATHC